METNRNNNIEQWQEKLSEFRSESDQIGLGGGAKAIERQNSKGRMTARERIAALVDVGSDFLEIGRWAAWRMYSEWGGSPSASVVCGVAQVANRQAMVIANDATVKAGAFFPMTCKKVLRAQRIAMFNRLPLIYLVDSAGVFLPLQDEIFPDEDDFGRIFRNNAVISALHIPQIAAIMGNCVAGGGYLPVLCDKILMTEGSGLYLAGPALVKSAIGQEVSHEELGGAEMHASISGTIDFREPDDAACIERLKKLVDTLPTDSRASMFRSNTENATNTDTANTDGNTSRDSGTPADQITDIVPLDSQKQYEVRDLIDCIVDADSFQEYKSEYGQSIVCGYARIDGCSIGVVANQRHTVPSKKDGTQFGGVIYHDSADKASRFIMDCNQTWTPLVFLQDVAGFMVGRDSEQQGIIRAGAKLVNVISNSRVPKITLITGGSYGAGNYAMCGKAFDPRFIFAWPNARYAVMGGRQAASTLLDIQISAMRRDGNEPDAEELEALGSAIASSYSESEDIRYGAARLWVDSIIEPQDTRKVLAKAIHLAIRYAEDEPFRTGALQV